VLRIPTEIWQINNSYGGQNSYTLNYLLKNELDFQGFGTTFSLDILYQSDLSSDQRLVGTAYWRSFRISWPRHDHGRRSEPEFWEYLVGVKPHSCCPQWHDPSMET
jgi:hypothetical protein